MKYEEWSIGVMEPRRAGLKCWNNGIKERARE